jgi:hypothetical protein
MKSRMAAGLRELTAGIGLVVLSTIAICGLCEGLLRVVLFSDSFAIDALRKPWRYASGDDDYWKLSFIWEAGKKGQGVGRIDPELGWAPAKEPGNPLGIITETPYKMEDIRQPVLFFGDSFVAGATPIPYRIPQLLDGLSVDRSVLNYGVGGYGVDQIYLRFRKTAKDFDKPTILIGILTGDLDRGVLSFRTGQKPYFDIIDDALVVRNLPILPSTRDYVKAYPPKIRSYLARFILFRLEPLISKEWSRRWVDDDGTRRQIEHINKRLLRSFSEDAAANGMEIYTVLFYGEEDFSEQTWRERFLKATLDEVGLPYFDTKACILDYMKEANVQLIELFYQENGHPNEKGNQIISDSLFDWLRSREVF